MCGMIMTSPMSWSKSFESSENYIISAESHIESDFPEYRFDSFCQNYKNIIQFSNYAFIKSKNTDDMFLAKIEEISPLTEIYKYRYRCGINHVEDAVNLKDIFELVKMSKNNIV